MKWLMVAVIVGSTVLADLLQSFEMKRRGEVDVEDLRPGRLGECSPDWRAVDRWCWPFSSWRFHFSLL